MIYYINPNLAFILKKGMNYILKIGKNLTKRLKNMLKNMPIMSQNLSEKELKHLWKYVKIKNIIYLKRNNKIQIFI